jgi:SAM-dependent methyltransferase
VPEERLKEQVEWLREQWLWLLRTRIAPETGRGRRLKALDVGCGPGLVMDVLSTLFEVEGVDADADAVRACLGRGHAVSLADARRLPFADASYDVVLCSFLLMWTERPQAVLDEMARVSRRWVVCLAEPDYGGRVVNPPELAALDGYVVSGLRRRGADPMIGRKLPGLMRRAGLDAEVGVHPGAWDAERMRTRAGEEWKAIASDAGLPPNDERVRVAMGACAGAAQDGSLCIFNPVFYAIGRK